MYKMACIHGSSTEAKECSRGCLNWGRSGGVSLLALCVVEPTDEGRNEPNENLDKQNTRSSQIKCSRNCTRRGVNRLGQRGSLYPYHNANAGNDPDLDIAPPIVAFEICRNFLKFSGIGL